MCTKSVGFQTSPNANLNLGAGHLFQQSNTMTLYSLREGRDVGERERDNSGEKLSGVHHRREGDEMR